VRPVAPARRREYASSVRSVTAADICLRTLPHAYDEQKRTGFKPRRDCEPWPLALPLDWCADPFADRNWCFQLHAWRMTDPIIAEYLATGSTGVLREAIDIALDWCRHHRDGSSTPFSWYDMSTGIRAMRLAFFLDRMRAQPIALAPADNDLLLDASTEHAARLQDESFINPGNHGLFQVFGLQLLSSVLGDTAGAAFAARMFERILAEQFTEEGIHREHSPLYHHFARGEIDRLNGAEKFNSPKTATLLDRARRAWPWLVHPNGEIVRVGDSDGRHKVAPPSRPVAQLKSRAFAVGDFSRSGYAIVRSLPSEPIETTSMLFVTGMAYNNRHKHADDLSFELFEFGRRVFIDSGRYGYNTDDMRRYVLSAAAHNTISLADEPMKPTQIAYTGTQLAPIETSDDGFVISGSIERPRHFRQHRHFLYDPGRSLTIEDRLSSDRERSFVSSLHLAPDLVPAVDDRGFSVTIRPGVHMRADVHAPDCRIEHVRGQTEPLLGWSTKGYLAMEPTSVVRAVTPAREARLAWHIRFQLT